MSVTTLAAVWALAGVVAGFMVRRLRVRRLGALVPMACGLASLAASPAITGRLGSASGLDRTAAGLLAACGITVGLAQLLAPAHDGAEPAVAGLTGAAAVVLLGTQDVLGAGLALLAGTAVIGLRWILVSPGRATLAAARVPLAAAAAITAAAVFLPVPPGTGPRSSLVGGLLLGGLAGLLALLPLGGWAAAAMAGLRSGDIAAWALLLLPATLLAAGRLASGLPQPGLLLFQHGLLATGLLSAIWSSIHAARETPGHRYIRILLADVALVAAGIGSTQPQAVGGGLLLVLAHLVSGPLLLQRARPELLLPRRLVWIGLTGLPPAPAFWGRFLILEACAAANNEAGLLAAVAMGFLFLAAVLVVVRGEQDSVEERGPRLLGSLAWIMPAGALALGLAPAALGRLVFGSL
jgi:hypothetical protein